ncbi:high-affinity choline transporter 1-like [Leptodactylus fuscus]
MALNVPALLSVLLFYALTLGIGVWASRKSKKLQKNGNRMEVAIVGGRKVNMVIGLFTTTATWVGGAYINGSAEIVYLPGRGLAWLQVPVGFALGLILGAIFFVTPMRSKKYLTMMDPLQEAYGDSMTCLLFIPALIADVCWFAAILASLASAVSVILDIASYLSIIISACIVITYTLFGGLYSVVYTDVIQLVFMVLGLWICIPFAVLNSATKNIAETAVHRVFQAPWLGNIDRQYIGIWIDDLLYLVINHLFSFVDWNQTSYGLPSPYERGEASMILPIVLQHLCPLYVSVVGLGAVAAAVMSSADSALLSSSSLFGYNIYKRILRKTASEKEVMVAMRISTIVLGGTATGMAFLSNSIYDLWFMCGEMVYALVFPQLCCVLFVPRTNTYGSVIGFFLGFILRLLGGMDSINIPPIIHYPWCTLINGAYVQLFPFKTFTMLVTLSAQILVSYVSEYLFKKSWLPKRWDICNVLKGEDASAKGKEEMGTFHLQNMSNNEPN